MLRRLAGKARKRRHIDKLTGRQQCWTKPSGNHKTYTEDSVSKKTLLLAVGRVECLIMPQFH